MLVLVVDIIWSEGKTNWAGILASLVFVDLVFD